MTIEECKNMYIGFKNRNLTIIDITTRPRNHSRTGVYMEKIAICKCDCGNIHNFRLSDVIHGAVGSCGCLRDRACKENVKLANQAFKEKYVDQRRGNTFTEFPNGIIQVDSHHNPDVKFYVDKITWNWLKVFTWSISNSRYVTTCVNYRNFTYHSLIIACPPSGYTRDHIDRNKANNTYQNLRITTFRGNMINKDYGNTTSGTTGIAQYYGKWVATGIAPDGKILRESFDSKEQAIERRKQWEQEYYYIEEIQTPRLILPDGTLNYRNFRWDWYPREFDYIWNFLGIQIIPF